MTDGTRSLTIAGVECSLSDPSKFEHIYYAKRSFTQDELFFLLEAAEEKPKQDWCLLSLSSFDLGLLTRIHSYAIANGWDNYAETIVAAYSALIDFRSELGSFNTNNSDNSIRLCIFITREGFQHYRITENTFQGFDTKFDSRGFASLLLRRKEVHLARIDFEIDSDGNVYIMDIRYKDNESLPDGKQVYQTIMDYCIHAMGGGKKLYFQTTDTITNNWSIDEDGLVFEYLNTHFRIDYDGMYQEGSHFIEFG